MAKQKLNNKTIAVLGILIGLIVLMAFTPVVQSQSHSS